MQHLIASLTCLLVLFLSPASAKVAGGPCEYETIIGTAVIVQPQDGQPVARFTPGTRHFFDKDIHLPRRSDFKLQQLISGQVGDSYPAAASVITKGSCTPLNFWLLATEQRTIGQYAPFSKEGQISLGGSLTVEQIASAFHKLSPARPQLVLDVCGQTGKQGSAEYNLMLGERYARQVSTQLVALGVPAARIHSYSAGEDSCQASTVFDDELQHGVWFRFLLHGTQQLSSED